MDQLMTAGSVALKGMEYPRPTSASISPKHVVPLSGAFQDTVNKGCRRLFGAEVSLYVESSWLHEMDSADQVPLDLETFQAEVVSAAGEVVQALLETVASEGDDI